MSAAGQALRRRIILAAILLAAFIVLLRVAVLAGEFDTVITAATFEAARENRTVLRAFLHRMPKGGDHGSQNATLKQHGLDCGINIDNFEIFADGSRAKR